MVSEIQSAGGKAHAFAGDLTNPGVADRAVAASVVAHGGLHVLVNNAGVGAYGNLAETTDETWDRVIATNLSAVFRLTRAALPHLTQKGGHVFMISSLAGTNPIAGMAAYCASKAALDHLAACLMLEVRQQGVKVTTIAPGSVDELRRLARGNDTSGCSRGKTSQAALDLIGSRDGAHLSRVEMRPARPQKRV